MFIMLSSWQSHSESWSGSYDEYKLSAKLAKSKTKPTDCEFTNKRYYYYQHITIAIYYYYSARKLNLFIIPQRVVGWVLHSVVRVAAQAQGSIWTH